MIDSQLMFAASTLSASSFLTGTAAAVLLADFFSGLVHWAEDAYARKDTPIIGRLIGDANIEHHQKPRAFVGRSYLASSWDLILVSSLVLLVAWFLGRLSWQVWVFALVFHHKLFEPDIGRAGVLESDGAL